MGKEDLASGEDEETGDGVDVRLVDLEFCSSWLWIQMDLPFNVFRRCHLNGMSIAAHSPTIMILYCRRKTSYPKTHHKHDTDTTQTQHKHNAKTTQAHKHNPNQLKIHEFNLPQHPAASSMHRHTYPWNKPVLERIVTVPRFSTVSVFFPLITGGETLGPACLHLEIKDLRLLDD